jgi:predicted cobalt transporter CbtA
MTETLPYPSATRQPPPFGPVLGRVLLAGVLAGVLAGAFSLLVTERTIAPALALEEARTAADAGSPAHAGEVFSRTTQMWGGFLGTVLAAVVFSVLFAVAYAMVRHRLPARTDFGRMVLLAVIGFGVFALLPALTVPANPPAVGDPGTITTRTGIYAAVLLCGAVIAMLVSALVSLLRSRGASVAAVAAVLLALVLVLLPGSPDTIPGDVPATVVWNPATVVWNFRLASLGQLAVLWAVLGLVGGWLVDRLAGTSTS